MFSRLIVGFLFSFRKAVRLFLKLTLVVYFGLDEETYHFKAR